MRLQLSKVPLVDGWMAGWMGGWMRGAGARCSCTPDHPSESGLAPTGPSGARAHSGQQIPYEHSQVARTASYLRAGNPRSQSPFTDRRRYCTCLAPPVQRTIGTRSVTTAVLPSLPLPLPPANHHRHSQPLASRPGPFLLPFSPGRHETALGYAALKVLEVRTCDETALSFCDSP